MRLSIAHPVANPKEGDDTSAEAAFGNFVPSTAWKMFRDNVHSANTVTMNNKHGAEGIKSWNYFDHRYP